MRRVNGQPEEPVAASARMAYHHLQRAMERVGWPSSLTPIVTASDSTFAHHTLSGIYATVGGIAPVAGNAAVQGYTESGGTSNTLRTGYVHGNGQDVQGSMTVRAGN